MTTIKKVAKCGLILFMVQIVTFFSCEVFADELLTDIKELARQGKVIGSEHPIGSGIEDVRNDLSLPNEQGSDYVLYKAEGLRFSFNELRIVTRIDNKNPAILNQITPTTLRTIMGKYIPIAQYEKCTYNESTSYVCDDREKICYFHPWGFTYQWKLGDYILVFNFLSEDKKYHADIHPDRYYVFKHKPIKTHKRTFSGGSE